MARNTFKDPAGDLDDYDWPVNHTEEDATSFKHNFEVTPNTAGTRPVRQQGADTPVKLRYSGTILRHEQVEEFGRWFELCASQTVEFEDCSGDSYEVFISSWEPKRERVARNPRDGSRPWIWRYTIEMDIVNILTGVHDQISVP